MDLETIVGIGITAGIINQFPWPVLESLYLSSQWLVNIKVPEETLAAYGELPREFTARDYLNLANSLVHTKGKVKERSRGYACLDLSLETYHVFRELVRRNQRKDLEKNVRFVGGFSPKVGHAWLEICEEGKYIPYETTVETPELDVSDIPTYSLATQEDKRLLAGGNERLYVDFRSLPGSDWIYPTVRMLFYPGGLIRLVYERIRVDEEIKKYRQESVQRIATDNTLR